MTGFVAGRWLELVALVLILAASWFVLWAFEDVLTALVFAVPFGWGVGMAVVEIKRKPM